MDEEDDIVVKEKKRSKSEIKVSNSKNNIEGKMNDKSFKEIKLDSNEKQSADIKKKPVRKIDAKQTKISDTLSNVKVGEKRTFKETGYKFEDIELGTAKRLKR